MTTEDVEVIVLTEYVIIYHESIDAKLNDCDYQYDIINSEKFPDDLKGNYTIYEYVKTVKN